MVGPPIVDLEYEKALAEVLMRESRRALLTSAHDLADGGLALTLVESGLAAWQGRTYQAACQGGSVRLALLREHGAVKTRLGETRN